MPSYYAVHYEDHRESEVWQHGIDPRTGKPETRPVWIAVCNYRGLSAICFTRKKKDVTCKHCLKIMAKPAKVKPQPAYDHDTGMRIGGHLRDAEFKPIRRRWPKSTIKREVTVRINSYRGIAIGARHFYLDIEVEHNTVWSWKEGCWTQPWDDKTGKGRQAHFNFLSERAALSSILIQVEKYPPDKYRIRADFDSKFHVDLLKRAGYEVRW